MNDMRKPIALFLSLVSVLLLYIPQAEAAGTDFVISSGVLTKYTGRGGSVSVPEGVTAIGDHAFRDSPNLTAVTLPERVQSIGYAAFYNCTGLERVKLGGGLRKIGEFAFKDCESLRSIAIPDGVTEIGDYAFFGCAGLEQVVIGDGLRTLDAFSFSYNTNLRSVVLGAGVEEVGDSAFWGCESLERAALGENVGEIGDSAFSNCTSLQSLALPEKVKHIGTFAFNKCASLQSVRLNEGLESIGSYAFQGCASLRSLRVPDSVTAIGDQVFRECLSLEEAVLGSGLDKAGELLFYGCESLRSVTLPTSGRFAEQLRKLSIDGFWQYFRGCSQIEEIRNNPCTAYVENLSANREALEKWVNPGAHLTKQSGKITAASAEITKGVSGDYAKAEAVYTWIRENLTYDNDYFEGKKDTVATKAEEVLESRTSVCAGYANLNAALLQAAGIPASYVTGPAYGAHGWELHAWNEAFVDGRWVLIDTTFGYFDYSSAGFSGNHTIGENGRPAASEQDTPSVWAREEVWTAVCQGLVPWGLQGDYRRDITRLEFCQLMMSLIQNRTGMRMDAYLESRGLTPGGKFTDTKSASVLAAHALGIVGGRSETVFDPDGAITRQEAAAMLARTARVLGIEAGREEKFRDEADIAAWARESVGFVSGLQDRESGRKVMGGTGDGRFSPESAYSREQAVLTALRLFRCE